MLRILTVNLFRSILLQVLSCVLIAIVTLLLGALFVWIGILYEWVILLIVGACSLLAVFLWIHFTFGEKSNLIPSDYWEKRAKKKKSPKAWRILLVLVVHLLLAGAGVYAYLEYLPSLMELEEIEKAKISWLLMTVFAEHIFFQGFYFFGMLLYYRRRICRNCKRIFCIGTRMDDYKSSTDTEYKTERNRVQAGSIKSGSTEIAKVYRDVDSHYSRNVTTFYAKYTCTCMMCGHSFKMNDRGIYTDDWK